MLFLAMLSYLMIASTSPHGRSAMFQLSSEHRAIIATMMLNPWLWLLYAILSAPSVYEMLCH